MEKSLEYIPLPPGVYLDYWNAIFDVKFMVLARLRPVLVPNCSVLMGGGLGDRRLGPMAYLDYCNAVFDVKFMSFGPRSAYRLLLGV